MEKILEQIVATPVGDLWAVECSACGPVALADALTVDEISSAHLQGHQAA